MRLSEIADDVMNCGPVLNWFEVSPMCSFPLHYKVAQSSISHKIPVNTRPVAAETGVALLTGSPCLSRSFAAVSSEGSKVPFRGPCLLLDKL